jgi:hypothetical protein
VPSLSASCDDSVTINKKDLSERAISSNFINPVVKRAGWDGMMQIREEVAFTKERFQASSEPRWDQSDHVSSASPYVLQSTRRCRSTHASDSGTGGARLNHHDSSKYPSGR